MTAEATAPPTTQDAVHHVRTTISLPAHARLVELQGRWTSRLRLRRQVTLPTITGALLEFALSDPGIMAKVLEQAAVAAGQGQ